RDEADVVRVAAACWKHRIPITPRGVVIGNYGQAVPLEGGALLDLTNMTTIEWQKPGVIRCAGGLKMNDLEPPPPPKGWGRRIHPPPRRGATTGAFVAGGWGGAGWETN